VQLAGAAAVQDVGLLVTAHSTTVTSTAAFTGFAVGAAPEPEPEPEPAPRCPVPGTDEFDGDSLDTTRWTTLRQADGAALDVAAGALALPVAQGDINEGAQGPISYAGQPTRPGAWEVTTKLTLAHSGHWQHAGLLQHATDDEYVKLAFTRMQDGSRVIEWQSETGGARTWHDQVALPQDTPTTIHLKLVSDGTALSAAYSVDGTVWTALEGTTPVEARSTTGVMAAGDTAAPTATALVDWFRVAPDDEPGGEREPSDEFEGDALDPCRWDAITRYDSRALAVADGELRITTQPGDINGTANEGPRNFVLQEVPEGDWTIETRLRATMAHQYQLAGLLAYGGDDDYVKLDIVAQNASGQPVDLRAELVSETGADFGGGGNRSLDVPETTESGWFQLRLSKTGSAYSGEVSVDGTDWTPIGEPVTHEGALSTVGLMAIGPLQTAPATVAFDWFRHSGGGTEEPDTTAPVVQVTTDPAQPAGLAGWHTGPVTVSATGTDDRGGTVLLEHQVGTGDWTEHTGPVTVTAEGRTAVQVRGTDEAGNVSEPVALEVALDSVAPQLRVRGVRPDQVLDLRTTVRPVATATDATSGVASVQLALDGQPVTSGRPVVPAVGAHTLVAVATDAAGHRTTVTLRFTVVADYDGVQRLVSALHAERQLSTSQLNQLRNHVGAALRASTRGQAQQERAALDRAIAVARRVSGAAARGELVAALQDLRRQV
jgi:regulation of enolase protein 1 (concanavalin A-like superfamily)